MPETPLFEDTKRIMSPEVHSKSFGTFDKQAPGPQVSLHLTGPLVITCYLLTEMAILLKDVKIYIINVRESHKLFWSANWSTMPMWSLGYFYAC